MEIHINKGLQQNSDAVPAGTTMQQCKLLISNTTLGKFSLMCD
jgi:hypothetical protein